MKSYSFLPEAEKELIDALARSRDPIKFNRRVSQAIDDIARGRTVCLPWKDDRPAMFASTAALFDDLRR